MQLPLLPALLRRAALAALAVLLTAAPAARADVRGAVAGVRDPAAGIVELTVLASEGRQRRAAVRRGNARRRAARRRGRSPTLRAFPA